MQIKTELIIIDRQGWPLETFRGYPILNFLRRLVWGSHKECKECYERRKNIKVETRKD